MGICTQGDQWPCPFQPERPRKGRGKACQVVFGPHCFTWPHLRNLYLSLIPCSRPPHLAGDALTSARPPGGWVMKTVPAASYPQGWKVDRAHSFLVCDTPCPYPREQASLVSLGCWGGRGTHKGSLTASEYSVLSALHEELKSSCASKLIISI